MRKILVGTDGSRGTYSAIVAAAQLAQDTSAELCILTVGGTLSGQEPKKLGRIGVDIGEALELLSNQVLNQAKKQATQVGAAKIKLRAGSGEPAQVIIEVAQRENADLVVIDRRGRGLLAGLLLRSVWQKIARSRSLHGHDRSLIELTRFTPLYWDELACSSPCCAAPIRLAECWVDCL